LKQQQIFRGVAIKFKPPLLCDHFKRMMFFGGRKPKIKKTGGSTDAPLLIWKIIGFTLGQTFT